MAVLLTCFLALVNFAAISNAEVSLYTSQDKETRMRLIHDGLIGKLKSHEERAQFHILMCQPKKAWAEAEKISSSETRNRFEGAILALVAVPREELDFADEQEMRAGVEAQKKPPVAKATRAADKIAMAYPLETQEVWDDELEDLSLGSSCDFPTVDNTKLEKFSELAKARLTPVMQSEGTARVSLASLASDVGLKPILSEKELGQLILQTPTYADRLKWFAQAAASDQSHEISIQGLHAQVSVLQFQTTDLEPHSLELPWLLEEKR
jgi:hypothetical protein